MRDDLTARLTTKGLDADSLTAALERAGVTDAAPFVESLERFVDAVGAPYSITRHVLPRLPRVTGSDPATFDRVLRELAAVLTVNRDARFEQQAVAAVAWQLDGRPDDLSAVLLSAKALVDVGVEPGWLCQSAVAALAQATSGSTFRERLEHLVAFARALHERQVMHVGYPVAQALAALVARADADSLPRWLDVLRPLATTAGREAYPLFEYGVTALAQGQLDAAGLTDALKLALSMLDHGLEPGPTLRAMSDPLALDVATSLARAGVDPALAVTNGLRVFGALGWLEDDGARLVTLAIELHRRGLRTLLLEDGLDVLPGLEQHEAGLATRALELIEAMVSKDLEPGVLMRWSLPRTLAFLRPTWAPRAALGFARRLVDAGVPPEPAVAQTLRPLVELADDEDAFHRLAVVVVSLGSRLRVLGGRHGDALFRDVATLAEAGGEPKAFLELLAAFEALASTWTERGLELEPLLTTAVPAAARESTGRPWVLASALEAALRLAREGRGTEALTLLEFGVGTAAQVGPGSRAHFVSALSAVEARYAALPASLTRPGSLAASRLAGTDVNRLSEALDVVAELHRAHGPALEVVASVVPELARVASSPSELRRLVEVVIQLRASFRDALAGVVDVVLARPRTSAESEETLRALAASLELVPSRAESVRVFSSLARLVDVTTLVRQFERVHAALSTTKHRALFVELLERASDEQTLEGMVKALPAVLDEARPPLLDGLARAKELLPRHPLAWRELVWPALDSAKQHAGPVLRALVALPSSAMEQPADLAVLKALVTQRGVRAVELLVGLVGPALRKGVMPSLDAHDALLEQYLREVGFADVTVYAQFVTIVTSVPVEQREREVAALRGRIDSLTAAIRAGQVEPEARRHPLFGVALQHVFPAAVSATSGAWVDLVDVMEDRPGDVTAMFDKGHRASLELSASSWQLVEGAKGLDVFGWYGTVRPADDAPPEPLVDLGWRLLTSWSESTLARAAVRDELTRALLAHVPVEERPSAAHDTASQVLAIRDVTSDALRALVEAALLSARERDGARVDRLIEVKLAPSARVGPGLVKSVAATFRALDAGAIDGPEAEQRLRRQLQALEWPADVQTLRGGAAALSALTPKRVVIEPGKEVDRVHKELVGQVLQQMNDCLSRALEHRPASQSLRLEFEVTKRSVHAPVGLTAGVCVARDVQLWKTPGFLHLVLWLDGVCAGGVHLLALEEAGARALCLPGVNPTQSLLERVDAETLVRSLLEHVAGVARAHGFSALWIPTAPAIHSNRAVIGDALAALRLPVRHTTGHPFSVSPYTYRIDDVWERRL